MSHERETLMNVTGMTCRSCVSHVDRALRGLDGVQAVQVRLQDGTARVTHDARQTPVATLIEAVREAGYDATAAA